MLDWTDIMYKVCMYYMNVYKYSKLYKSQQVPVALFLDPSQTQPYKCTQSSWFSQCSYTLASTRAVIIIQKRDNKKYLMILSSFLLIHIFRCLPHFTVDDIFIGKKKVKRQKWYSIYIKASFWWLWVNKIVKCEDRLSFYYFAMMVNFVSEWNCIVLYVGIHTLSKSHIISFRSRRHSSPCLFTSFSS